MQTINSEIRIHNISSNISGDYVQLTVIDRDSNEMLFSADMTRAQAWDLLASRGATVPGEIPEPERYARMGKDIRAESVPLTAVHFGSGFSPEQRAEAEKIAQDRGAHEFSLRRTNTGTVVSLRWWE